jgi:hypothetical protein
VQTVDVHARVPEHVLDHLRRQAQADERTLSGEIRRRLVRSIESDEALSLDPDRGRLHAT